MIDRIRRLEERARALEPDAATRRHLLEQVSAYAERFLEELPRTPAYRQVASPGAAIYDTPPGEDPLDPKTLLDLFHREVVEPGVQPASAGLLGFIPGGGLYPSALGDFLAAVTNKYAGVFFSGPGAVRMERMLVRWFADEVGYPDTTLGDLASGGSIANLSALAAAREATGLAASEVSRAVVYVTEHTHHCVAKALRLAGLGEAVRRTVPLDEAFRMDPDALERSIGEDRRAGLRPWLIVATAGSTDTGAVDPLDEIADIAALEDVRLHVDGAYGAAFVLCETGRARLRGVERSDSLVFDPHKGLFLPFGTGMVLVRDGESLRRAFSYEAAYMRDTRTAAEELSPAETSPELSRHFRGLRMWFPLLLFGLAPFRAALEEKMLLARWFHDAIAREPGFEAGPPPDLSVVTFRYVPRRGDPDAGNEAILRAVREDGRVLLTSTVLGGKLVLRLAVLGFRTHLDTVRQALEIVTAAARDVENR